MLKSLILMRD